MEVGGVVLHCGPCGGRGCIAVLFKSFLGLFGLTKLL